MLNIGKVVRGREDYCLDRVADSQEEYTGAGEAPGYWLGRAVGELGVGGQVSEEGLHRVLNGAHPQTAARLGAPPRRARVLAYDLTFRAPKSVSLLYGLGEATVCGQVRAAHEQAVAAAVGYLERHAAVVARGHARQRQEPARGVVAAAFQHRTSRAGDPLLHTHVLVANLAQGPDGRWTALGGRALWRHARTAGYLYQAGLRWELGRRLGVAWGPVRHGTADLDGVPRGVVEAFSQRRQQIRRRLAELGHHSARAAQAATLATRPAKPVGVTAGTLRCRWQQQAAALGLGGRDLVGLLGKGRPQPLTGPDVERLGALLASADGLTRQASTFTRRDVVQAVCDQLPGGAGVEDVGRLADAFLGNQQVVCQLTPQQPAGAADSARFSTHELLGIEARVVAAGARRRHDGAGVVAPAAVSGALAAHAATEGLRATLGLRARHLEADQVALVERLVGSGHGIELVNAKAGAGKTFALRVARLAWERGGYRVVGAALAAQAARQLTDEAGIDSRTIARQLWELEDPRAPGFHPKTVLVIDEASMVGTRQLERLLWHAERAAAKVVLVGDAR